MCGFCGCGKKVGDQKTAPQHDHHTHADQTHSHSLIPGHSHDHGHSHDQHDHQHSRSVDVERSILAHNEEHAQGNRKWLDKLGITMLNFVSSPGSGKTLLLERTLDCLKGQVACGVIVGDQESDNDARRLSGRGAEVRQIETGHACHLDAQRVGEFLPEVVSRSTKLLFIENVGNLICPAAFNLGENLRVVLLSATEGEDKPVKYPVAFAAAHIIVLTKIDLVPHLDWSRAVCLANLKKIAPSAKLFELSAKSGMGMEEWVRYLRGLVG